MMNLEGGCDELIVGESAGTLVWVSEGEANYGWWVCFKWIRVLNK